MRYFRLNIIILTLILFSQICSAEQWETIERGNTKYIAIDIDSVNYHNNSIYYNVFYNVLSSISDNSTRDEKYVTIQSKGNHVGVVKTGDNKECLNALTPKVATNFKTLTTDSLLYEANLRAQEVYEWSKKDVNVKDMPYFKTYMRDVQNRIKMRWEPPKSTKTLKATALFKISKDGRLVDCEITKSSGDKEFDYVALQTIKSTPFRPLPEQYKGANVNIAFDFNFNQNVQNSASKYLKRTIEIINNGL